MNGEMTRVIYWFIGKKKLRKKLERRRQTLSNLSLNKHLSLARTMLFSKFEFLLMARLSHRLSFTNLSQQQEGRLFGTLNRALPSHSCVQLGS